MSRQCPGAVLSVLVLMHRPSVSAHISHLLCAMGMAGARTWGEGEQTPSPPPGHRQVGRQTNATANPGRVTGQAHSDRNIPHLWGKSRGANKRSRRLCGPGVEVAEVPAGKKVRGVGGRAVSVDFLSSTTDLYYSGLWRRKDPSPV